MPDYTTINVAPGTRDAIREFRDEHGCRNYDAAAQALLEAAGVTDNVEGEA
jgi:hypothetical protein